MSAQRNNRISNSVIQQQYARYGKAWCEYCGKEVFTDVPVTSHNRCIGDHRIPMSRGGENIPENIAIACHNCDQSKGPLTKEEFLSVFDDIRERKRLINKVLYDLGRVPRLYDYDVMSGRYTHHRNIVRRNSLVDRLKDPDPHCQYCEGTGKIKKSSAIFHYCRCSVTPKHSRA